MNRVPFPIEVAAGLIRDSSTLATPLLVICLAAYKEEFFGDTAKNIPPMDPIELVARLQEDFRADLTEKGENRINAIRLALETDAFYEDPVAFAGIAKSLASGDIGDLADGFEEQVELPEALWVVYEVSALRDDDISLSPQVLALFDKVIADDAQEPGEDGASAPELFVHDMKLDLASQLQALGVQFPIKELTHA